MKDAVASCRRRKDFKISLYFNLVDVERRGSTGFSDLWLSDWVYLSVSLRVIKRQTFLESSDNHSRQNLLMGFRYSLELCLAAPSFVEMTTSPTRKEIPMKFIRGFLF